MKDKIQFLHSTPVFDGKVFQVVKDEIKLPNGALVERCIVKHPGAVVIIPQLEDGRLLLVHQYRHAVRDTLFEFPAGTLEPGESPLDCAKREVIEEVGHRAEQWQELGLLYPAPGFCSEVQHLFFATKLSPAQAPGDEDEIIEVRKMTVQEIEDLITTDQMLDAKSIAAFTRARLKKLL